MTAVGSDTSRAWSPPLPGEFQVCEMTAATRVEKPMLTITKASRDHTVDRTDRILVHSARGRRPKPSPEDPVAGMLSTEVAGATVITGSVRRAGVAARVLRRWC